jgi:hypothetical protein
MPDRQTGAAATKFHGERGILGIMLETASSRLSELAPSTRQVNLKKRALREFVER